MVDDSTLSQLRPWIEQQLKPISEADAEVMTDYVMALLKHDLPVNELRKMCEEQLEEFLHSHTSEFVNNLIQALEAVQGGYNPAQQTGVVPAPVPMPQETGFHGQEQFRRNFRNGRNGFEAEYNPENASFVPQQQQQQQQQPWGQSFIPTMPGIQMPPGIPSPSSQGFIPPFEMPNFPGMQGFNDRRGGRRGGRGGRGGGGPMRQGRGQMSQMSGHLAENDFSNTRLIVEKVPDDKFNEASIREYFSKFGNLLSVSIDDRQHVAELEYASHDQARDAWNSPEVIFDNRFVKLYWRKREASELSKPLVDVDAVARIQAAKQKAFEEKEAKRKAHEEKLKQLVEMKMRVLQEQERILKLTVGTQGDTDDDKEQLSNTEALKKQLEALKAEADSLGISSSPATRGGRGGYRGRGGYHPYTSRGGRGGRGAAAFAPTARSNLDLRPKSVAVGPIPGDKEEPFRSHLLSTVGEFDNVRRTADDIVVVDFKDRKSAEKFFYGAKDIPDIGSIEKQWQRGESPAATQSEAMDTA